MANTETEITVNLDEAVRSDEQKKSDNTDVSALNKEIEKLKRQLSNANSEASSYKKALREKQTAEEQAAADLAEKQKAMEAELESYRKRETISNYKVKFMGLGFDEKTAQATAETMVGGDMDSVFANLKDLTDNIAKNAVTKAMDSQGGLTKGAPPTGADIDNAEEIALRKAFGL